MCTEAILKDPERKDTAYELAEIFLADGKTAQAAMAFGKLGNYSDAWQRSMELWDTIARRDTVGVGTYHTVGLKTNGTVLAVKSGDYGQCDVDDWRNIVAIDAEDTYTVGLKSDGTVVAAGSDYFQEQVAEWQDIVAISTCDSTIIGLKSDGTVVVTGSEYARNQVAGWQDIVDVGAGDSYAAGLRSDGTVVATIFLENNPSRQVRETVADIVESVSNWTDITTICTGSNFIVGLKANGTVVAAGANQMGQCEVSGWTDIVALNAGGGCALGVKADGTVVSTGNNEYSDWSDLVAIDRGPWHTVGLKSDGTVVATGMKMDDRCDVSGWEDIKLPNRDAGQEIELYPEEEREEVYQKALTLMKQGVYFKAVADLQKLGDYKDSKAQLQICIQQYKDVAYGMMAEGNGKYAMDIFLKMEELGIDCSKEKQECELAMVKYGKSQYVTSGSPVDNETAVYYTVEGNVEVHNFTRVDLDNGCVRYTIDCTPPECSAVSFFNPPDGDIFMHTNWNDHAQERQNIVFDVTKEQIEAANELTIRFGESGSWIFVRYPY